MLQDDQFQRYEFFVVFVEFFFVVYRMELKKIMLQKAEILPGIQSFDFGNFEHVPKLDRWVKVFHGRFRQKAEIFRGDSTYIDSGIQKL